MSEWLPDNWCYAQIGELCDLINGKAFKKSDWSKDGLPIIRIQNLNNPDALFNYFKGELPNKFYVENGHLLFAWSGTPGTSFGAHIWNGGSAVLNQHIFKVEFNENLIDKQFYFYAINQKLNELISNAQGGVGLRHITKKRFEQTKINFPPLLEQKRISSKLNCLLAKVDACKKRLDKVPEIIRRFRQSVLADAVSGKLTEDWRSNLQHSASINKTIEEVFCERREFWEKAQLEKLAAKGKLPKNDKWKSKYKEIQEVNCESLYSLPSEWRWVPWELVLAYEDGAFKRGPFGSAIKKAFFVESGYKVYEQYCPINDDPSYVRYYISKEKYKELEAFAVRGRDFLISCSGVTLGRITQIPENYEKGVINQALLRVRLNGKIINDSYFKLMFRSLYFQKKIFDNSTGSAQPNVKGVKELKAIPIPLPPLEEQEEIIRKVDTLCFVADQMDEKLTIAKSKVDNLTASILSKAFNGDLVHQNHTDEPAELLLKRIRAEREALAANIMKGGRTPKKSLGRGKRSKTKKSDAEADPEPAVAVQMEASVDEGKERKAKLKKQPVAQIDKRFEKTEVLKAFRKVIFRQTDIDEYTLMRLVGQRFGVNRLSKQIRLELESYIRTAIRRKIIARNGNGYDSATPTIHHYDEKYLINALKSQIRKGYEYQRSHIVENLAVYLGYDKASDAFAQRMKTIFRLAIRRGELYRNEVYVGKF